MDNLKEKDASVILLVLFLLCFVTFMGCLIWGKNMERKAERLERELIVERIEHNLDLIECKMKYHEQAR